MTDIAIKIEHLNYVYSPGTAYEKHALKDICLEIPHGEFVGIIGHTGSGKSTLIQHLNGLVKATDGALYYNGENIYQNGYDMRALRNQVGLVFQYPEYQLFEIDVLTDVCFGPKNQGLSKEEARKKVVEMLADVKIPNPEVVAKQYPHQLSGGMRQRVMIAMALACKPKLLIADEPTTALDVTIQAQILKLMNDLKREHGTSILFITHDLGVIAQMADDVAVMYCGQVVEMAPAKTLFTDCEFSHPYTEGLMVSIPRLDTPAGVRLESIPGSVPHPLNLPKGCKFAPRCKYCQQRCLEEEPELVNVTEEQQVRCFYPRKEERRANLK